MTALRIGLHRSSGFVSSLIKWQSRSEYSHASLILPDDTVLESMQGRGVVQDRTVQSCGEVVDIFTVPAFASVHKNALTFAQAQLGKGYDYTMVARFITRKPATRKSSGLWFCSELVFASFAQAGLLLLRDTEAWEVSPELLSKSPYLIEAGTNKQLRAAA